MFCGFDLVNSVKFSELYTYVTLRRMVYVTVVEPLYDEFGEIQTKLLYEQSLRTAAESYAIKVGLHVDKYMLKSLIQR